MIESLWNLISSNTTEIICYALPYAKITVENLTFGRCRYSVYRVDILCRLSVHYISCILIYCIVCQVSRSNDHFIYYTIIFYCAYNIQSLITTTAQTVSAQNNALASYYHPIDGIFYFTFYWKLKRANKNYNRIELIQISNFTFGLKRWILCIDFIIYVFS